MKRVYKLTAFLLLFGIAKSLASASQDDLLPWYRNYNHDYFQDELPQTVVITHDLTDDRFMAVTQFSTGYYHIDFNPKYGYRADPRGSSITELRNLLHEMCHIRQFVENDLEFDDHGEHWENCMHKIADMRGFNNLW